jgi:ribose 5-phosphate isomerase A
MDSRATIETLKQQAAEAAVDQLASGMIIGLGSGSTADHAIRAVGRRLQEGRLRDILCVPSSRRSAQLAMAHNIPLTNLDDHPVIEITIDGADEVDPQLNLIKGLGGYLLREKVVAFASQRLVIVADDRKLVDRLGSQAPLPVEVIQFALQPVTTFLQDLGAQIRRRTMGEQPFITDEGNFILDCHFGAIEDAAALARQLGQQPGIVAHGLFLGIADEAIVGTPQGIKHLIRP